MRLLSKVLRKICAFLRRFFYSALSTAKINGKPLAAAPILAQGRGMVSFEKNVHVGLDYDTDFWTSYVFLNPRNSKSKIEIGEGSWVGNHFVAISEGPGIYIGKNVLVGTHVEIYDSDFHTVKPAERLSAEPKRAAVKIGNDVWLGNNVTLLKGVEIGDHSVVAAGAVVTGKFPPNVILGGIPAKIIGDVNA